MSNEDYKLSDATKAVIDKRNAEADELIALRTLRDELTETLGAHEDRMQELHDTVATLRTANAVLLADLEKLRGERHGYLSANVTLEAERNSMTRARDYWMAQHSRAAADHEALRACFETLKHAFKGMQADRDAIVAELQKLQPGGSPPPGGPVQLAMWIVATVLAERDDAQRKAKATGGLLELAVKRRDDCRVLLDAAIARGNSVRGALEDLVQRCDGAEGVRADGSNIDTRAAHAILEALETST